MTRTPVAARCLLVVVGILVVGLLAGHPFVVALAVPFVVGPALGRRTRAPAQPRVALHLADEVVWEGDLLCVVVAISATTDLDLVHLRLTVENLEPVGCPLDWTVALRAGEERVETLSLRAMRWGRHRVGPLAVSARGASLLEKVPDLVASPVVVSVYPLDQRLVASSAAPDALRYAGEHRSARTGPGVELAAVRPIAGGDRIRRINWRATLRSTELHVTTSFTDGSVSVLVLVDTVYDGGPAGSSTLDVAGRAAMAIAGHYLALGDVVAMAERGGTRRSLPGASGRQQLLRAGAWLLDLRSAATPLPAATGGARAGRAARSLVIAVSAFLDEGAAVELAALRQRGAAVLAIDVLSDDALPEVTDETSEVARRLWLLERQLYLDRLADLGVPVVRWSEEGSLEVGLTDLARMAALPRMATR